MFINQTCYMTKENQEEKKHMAVSGGSVISKNEGKSLPFPQTSREFGVVYPMNNSISTNL